LAENKIVPKLCSLRCSHHHHTISGRARKAATLIRFVQPEPALWMKMMVASTVDLNDDGLLLVASFASYHCCYY
jgi:hypothetical protein